MPTLWETTCVCSAVVHRWAHCFPLLRLFCHQSACHHFVSARYPKSQLVLPSRSFWQIATSPGAAGLWTRQRRPLSSLYLHTPTLFSQILRSVHFSPSAFCTFFPSSLLLACRSHAGTGTSCLISLLGQAPCLLCLPLLLQRPLKLTRSIQVLQGASVL